MEFGVELVVQGTQILCGSENMVYKEENECKDKELQVSDRTGRDAS